MKHLQTILKNRFPFWIQWLLHSLVVWLILTLHDLLTYLYRVRIWGNFIYYEDGSPLTVWQRFVMHTAEQKVWLYVLLHIFIIEAFYHYILKPINIKYLIRGSLVAGLATIFILLGKGPNTSNMVVLLYLTIFTTTYTIFYALIRNFIYTKLTTAEKNYQNVQAELNTLKAQINPHFFFNTLNSLYGTALQENALRTAESIEQLSGIMRYTTHEAQQNFTSVLSEIQFLQDYLHLQRLRMPQRENIQVNSKISYDDQEAMIAPMLLIPFVENAFKYGISIDHPCFVNIFLKVSHFQLHLVVENKILPNIVVTSGQGIGLENTRKRLQLLYPDNYSLDIQRAENFKIELKMNLKVADNLQPA